MGPTISEPVRPLASARSASPTICIAHVIPGLSADVVGLGVIRVEPNRPIEIGDRLLRST
jgi:hypothetical protein